MRRRDTAAAAGQQPSSNILKAQMLLQTFQHHLSLHLEGRPKVNLGRLGKSTKAKQQAEVQHKLAQAVKLEKLLDIPAGTTASFQALLQASAGTDTAGVQPGHFDSEQLLRETTSLCNQIFDQIATSKKSEATLAVLATALGRTIPANAPEQPKRHRAASTTHHHISSAAAAAGGGGDGDGAGSERPPVVPEKLTEEQRQAFLAPAAGRAAAPALPARDPASLEEITAAFNVVSDLQQYLNGFKSLPAHIKDPAHQQISEFQATLAMPRVTYDIIEEVTADAKQALDDLNKEASLAVIEGQSAHHPSKLHGAGIGAVFSQAQRNQPSVANPAAAGAVDEAAARSAPPPLPPKTARLRSMRFTAAPAAMAEASEIRAALTKFQQTVDGISKPGQVPPTVYATAAGALGKLQTELYGGQIESPQPTSVLERINEAHDSLLQAIGTHLEQRARTGFAASS